MLEPSIDELQEEINSKYVLVAVSAQRARELREVGNTVLENPHSKTFVGIALEEIKAGKLRAKEETK